MEVGEVAEGLGGTFAHIGSSGKSSQYRGGGTGTQF